MKYLIERTLKIFFQLEIFITRKYSLRGYFLAPLGMRQMITLKREKIFGGHMDHRPQEMDPDEEVEIVF